MNKAADFVTTVALPDAGRASSAGYSDASSPDPDLVSTADPTFPAPAERRLMTGRELAAALAAMAKALIKAVGKSQELCFVGIQTRGVPLAQRLADACGKLSGKSYPLGQLDINLYRDDLSEVDHHPVVRRTELPGHITGMGIILVDDVIFTGRTIRAALDALVDFGRPRFVQLAVLIDRGHRELPIHADYVGRQVASQRADNVHVRLTPIDACDEVAMTVAVQ